MDDQTLLAIAIAALVGFIIIQLMQSSRIGWLEDAAKEKDKRIDRIRDNQIADVEVLSERIDCERKRIGDQVERIDELAKVEADNYVSNSSRIARLARKLDKNWVKAVERLDGLARFNSRQVENDDQRDKRIDELARKLDVDRADAIECDKEIRAWRDGVDSKLGAIHPDHLANLDTQCRDLRSRIETLEAPAATDLAGPYTIGSDKPLRQDVKPHPSSKGPVFKDISGGSFDVMAGGKLLGRVKIDPEACVWRVPKDVMAFQRDGACAFYGTGFDAKKVQGLISVNWEVKK